MKESKAFVAGLNDGAEWDLSGYESTEKAAVDGGWSDATINAMGSLWCAKAWGVRKAEGPAWTKAMSDYDRGCRAAIARRAKAEAQS